MPRRLDFTLKGLLSALSSKNDRVSFECHERRREKGDNGDGSGVKSDGSEGSGVRSDNGEGSGVRSDNGEVRGVRIGDGVEEADRFKQMKHGETAIDEELEKMLDRKRMLDQLEKVRLQTMYVVCPHPPQWYLSSVDRYLPIVHCRYHSQLSSVDRYPPMVHCRYHAQLSSVDRYPPVVHCRYHAQLSSVDRYPPSGTL